MRIIAAVTLIFLPPTFTATFFSTGFFSFYGPDGSPAMTTSMFWLYWVVTVPLTLVVLLGWLGASRYRKDGLRPLRKEAALRRRSSALERRGTSSTLKKEALP